MYKLILKDIGPNSADLCRALKSWMSTSLAERKKACNEAVATGEPLVVGADRAALERLLEQLGEAGATATLLEQGSAHEEPFQSPGSGQGEHNTEPDQLSLVDNGAGERRYIVTLSGFGKGLKRQVAEVVAEARGISLRDALGLLSDLKANPLQVAEKVAPTFEDVETALGDANALLDKLLAAGAQAAVGNARPVAEEAIEVQPKKLFAAQQLAYDVERADGVASALEMLDAEGDPAVLKAVLKAALEANMAGERRQLIEDRLAVLLRPKAGEDDRRSIVELEVCSRTLPVTLTDAERQAAVAEAARLTDEKEDCEEEWKEVASAHKEKLKRLAAHATQQRRLFREGVDDRAVECRVEYDLAFEVVRTIRLDTSAIVATRAPTDSERQRARQGRIF